MKYKHFSAVDENGCIKDVLVNSDAYEENGYEPEDYFLSSNKDVKFVQDVEIESGEPLPDTFISE